MFHVVSVFTQNISQKYLACGSVLSEAQESLTLTGLTEAMGGNSGDLPVCGSRSSATRLQGPQRRRKRLLTHPEVAPPVSEKKRVS